MGFSPSTRSVLAHSARGSRDSGSNSSRNVSNNWESSVGKGRRSLPRLTRGGNSSFSSQPPGRPCGSSTSSLPARSCKASRRRPISSSPSRFSQRRSIMLNNGGQISLAASPLGVRRTIQSARMPRPLPQPSRSWRPAGSGCSTTNPHLSKHPSSNFIRLSGARACAASPRTDTAPSATNRIRLAQTTNESRAPG